MSQLVKSKQTSLKNFILRLVMIYCEGYGFIHRLLLFMGQKLIDVVHFFSFSFIEDSPDDKVDNRKLYNELEIKNPVEGEPTSQSC